MNMWEETEEQAEVREQINSYTKKIESLIEERTRYMNKLTVEDVQACIRHEDKRGRTSHVYMQLLDTMRENQYLRGQLDGLHLSMQMQRPDGIGINDLPYKESEAESLRWKHSTKTSE